MKLTPGISVVVSLGSYGGFNYQINRVFCRFCLGWLSLIIAFHDADYVLGDWYDRVIADETEGR